MNPRPTRWRGIDEGGGPRKGNRSLARGRSENAVRDGRSAFLRTAASFYLAAKQRRETDRRIADSYSHRADEMVDEIAEFMDLQEWPES